MILDVEVFHDFFHGDVIGRIANEIVRCRRHRWILDAVLFLLSCVLNELLNWYWSWARTITLVVILVVVVVGWFVAVAFFFRSVRMTFLFGNCVQSCSIHLVRVRLIFRYKYQSWHFTSSQLLFALLFAFVFCSPLIKVFIIYLVENTIQHHLIVFGVIA